MPCCRCGHILLLYEGEEICPACKQLSILDSYSAVKVGTRLVLLSTRIFNEELSNWERDTLLGNVAAKRELFARQYFRHYSLLDIGRLASLSLLFKRIVKYSNFTGRIPNHQLEIDKLLEVFEDVLEFESILLRIKSGYNNILRLFRVDENSFSLQDAKQAFVVVPNEKQLNEDKTFAIHNIFTADEAKNRFEDYSEKEIPSDEPIQYELLTPQDFIHKHYENLNKIFVLFHRNRTFAECFNLDYLQEVFSEPRDLLEFIARFREFEDDTITICRTRDFIFRASKYFDMPANKIKKLLIFDVNNKSVFPLFVRFRNPTLTDVVCITKDFSRFIYTILHAIITREFFDEETVQLSKEFENYSVARKFSEIGYTYVTNIIDKKKATLQIDGLAMKNDKCYIIECKGWRFPRLIDEPETKAHIERDLKGIVLGKEYSNKKGKIVVKDRPDIFKKIRFVRDNIHKLGNKYKFNSDPLIDFEAKIITIDYPPIPDYKGVGIISINQISSLK
jgi:hypothetical protein